MFNLCKHPAFTRNSEASKKTVTFKVSMEEYEAIKEMAQHYNEIYISNIIRIALKKMHDDMK